MSAIQYDGTTGIIAAYGQFDSAATGLLLGYVLDDAPLSQPGIKRLINGVVAVEPVPNTPPFPTTPPDDRVPIYQQYDAPPAPEGAATWLQPTQDGTSLDVYTTMPDRDGWQKSIDPVTLRQNIASVDGKATTATTMATTANQRVTPLTPRLDQAQVDIATLQATAILLKNRLDLDDALIADLVAKRPRTGTKTTTGLLLNITKADTLTWPEPFPNNNYRVVGAVVGGSAGMPTLRITGHTAATVSYEVRSGLLPGDVTVDFIGVPY